MKSARQVAQEVKEMDTIRAMLSSFEEIAARKMQSVRVGRELARDYYTSLSQVSSEVGIDLTERGLEQSQIGAVVLLGSNGGMYGELTERVALSTVAYLREHPTGVDVFVIGAASAEMVHALLPDLRFETSNVSDTSWDQSWWSSVIERLKIYRAVKVFYGQFVNLVNQQINIRDLSGEFTWEHLSQEVREERRGKLKYLYEPGVEAVAKTLSGEVFAQILDDTWHESQLAKLASRLIQLDNVVVGIDKRVKKLGAVKRQIRKRQAEKRRTQLLSGRRVGVRI